MEGYLSFLLIFKSLCKLKPYLGVLSLNYDETMSKAIRFVRERTPFILIIYGAYIYFRSFSSRAASDILSFLICRSHTSILSWFRSLSFLFPDKDNCGDVRVLLVDDTRIRIGSSGGYYMLPSNPILGESCT